MYYEEKHKNKSKVWLVFFILIIVGSLIGGVIVYKKIQEPVDDIVNKYANLNIMTIYDGKLISTGIIVQENGKEILNSKTTNRGATTLKVYFNNSISISTYNLDNQSYFIQSEELEINSPEPVQVKFRLVERGELEVEEKINRKSILIKVRNSDKDFGDLILFLNPRGLVIKNDGVIFDRIDSYYATEVGFDKAFNISGYFVEDEFVSITLPYVSVSNSATLEYAIGGLEHNEILGYSIVGGERNIINI